MNKLTVLFIVSSVFFAACGGFVDPSEMVVSSSGGTVVEEVVDADQSSSLSKPAVSFTTMGSTELTYGDVLATRFTVEAGPSGDASFRSIKLNVDLNNKPNSTLTVSTVFGYSGFKQVGSSYIPGIAKLSAFTLSGSTLSIDLVSDEVIAAGTSKTYDVVLHITGSGIAGDSLVTTFLDNGQFSSLPPGSQTLVR